MRKAGVKDYKSCSKEMLQICSNKSISLEVFANDEKFIIDQGKKIQKLESHLFS